MAEIVGRDGGDTGVLAGPGHREPEALIGEARQDRRLEVAVLRRLQGRQRVEEGRG